METGFFKGSRRHFCPTDIISPPPPPPPLGFLRRFSSPPSPLNGSWFERERGKKNQRAMFPKTAT